MNEKSQTYREYLESMVSSHGQEKDLGKTPASVDSPQSVTYLKPVERGRIGQGYELRNGLFLRRSHCEAILDHVFALLKHNTNFFTDDEVSHILERFLQNPDEPYLTAEEEEQIQQQEEEKRLRGQAQTRSSQKTLFIKNIPQISEETRRAILDTIGQVIHKKIDEGKMFPPIESSKPSKPTNWEAFRSRLRLDPFEPDYQQSFNIWYNADTIIKEFLWAFFHIIDEKDTPEMLALALGSAEMRLMITVSEIDYVPHEQKLNLSHETFIRRLELTLLDSDGRSREELLASGFSEEEIAFHIFTAEQMETYFDVREREALGYGYGRKKLQSVTRGEILRLLKE